MYGDSSWAEQSWASFESLVEVVNLIADLVGQGDLDAALTLTHRLAAELVGEGDLDGTLLRVVKLAADLAGAGEMDAALRVVRALAAELVGIGDLDAQLNTVFRQHALVARIFATALFGEDTDIEALLSDKTETKAVIGDLSVKRPEEIDG